jgi:hypothetical protein
MLFDMKNIKIKRALKKAVETIANMLIVSNILLKRLRNEQSL